MKIKNEYVKIKTNSKEIVLHNYIYNSYLELFSKGQYLIDEDIYSKKFLGSCYLKFDIPIADYQNATVDDFDLRIQYKQYEIIGNKSQVNVQYDYANNNLSSYYGKKITAIGFGSTYGNEIYACLDTSLYSIYIPEDNRFSITRRDSFSSEAICNGYPYPVHLAPQNNYENTVHNPYTEPLAILYSVGFGTRQGIMQEEYLIHNDFEVIVESDTEYGINLKIEKSQSKHPKSSYYPLSNKYPVKFYSDRIINPNKKVYPSVNKYPLASNYNYIIYKYQLYYIDYIMVSSGETVRLNQFYTMSCPIKNLSGLFEIKNIIERKD